MPGSKESERLADVARLDRAIDAMLDAIDAKLPTTGDPEGDALNALALSKGKAEAARALPALFARRAALLGLDQVPESKPSEPEKAGSLAELEKKLALVK